MNAFVFQATSDDVAVVLSNNLSRIRSELKSPLALADSLVRSLDFKSFSFAAARVAESGGSLDEQTSAAQAAIEQALVAMGVLASVESSGDPAPEHKGPALPEGTTQVVVSHWNAPRYGGEDESDGEQFLMEVVDFRDSNGQVMVNLAPTSGDVDDVLGVAVEVDTLPGTTDRVQTVRLYMGGDDVALNIFLRNGKFIIEAGEGVEITPTRLDNGARGWIVSD